jgi:hypothetical protein
MSDEPQASAISPELKAFIYSCFDAVEQVELLVLLQRAAEPWSARSAAQACGISDASARHHLETLAARGLLQIAVGQETTYRFAPKRAELQTYADALATGYADSRTAIVRLVVTSPLRSARRIADAFTFRERS